MKRYVDTFGHDFDLLITIANIPADTPSDHVHAAVAAIHTYGSKPTPPDLNTVQFVLPERESYRDWLQNKRAKS